MQKLKDMHEAAEKLRREKWIDEKTKKIKVNNVYMICFVCKGFENLAKVKLIKNEIYIV